MPWMQFDGDDQLSWRGSGGIYRSVNRRGRSHDIHIYGRLRNKYEHEVAPGSEDSIALHSIVVVVLFCAHVSLFEQ